MNTNIQGDFQICISVPLSISVQQVVQNVAYIELSVTSDLEASCELDIQLG